MKFLDNLDVLSEINAEEVESDYEKQILLDRD